MIEHPISVLAAAGVDHIFVVLGAYADEIQRRADLSPAEVIVCHDWARGQALSLRSGVEAAAARDASAVVVILGDEPWVSPAAVRAVIDARGAEIDAVRATYNGVPGHPTLLERSCFGHVFHLDGDMGAKRLLSTVRIQLVACDGLGSDADVDEPHDLLAAIRRGVEPM